MCFRENLVQEILSKKKDIFIHSCDFFSSGHDSLDLDLIFVMLHCVMVYTNRQIYLNLPDLKLRCGDLIDKISQ